MENISIIQYVSLLEAIKYNKYKEDIRQWKI